VVVEEGEDHRQVEAVEAGWRRLISSSSAVEAVEEVQQYRTRSSSVVAVAGEAQLAQHLKRLEAEALTGLAEREEILGYALVK
jgi:hypothetical protein